jgi:hypothetical protein
MHPPRIRECLAPGIECHGGRGFGSTSLKLELGKKPEEKWDEV